MKKKIVFAVLAVVLCGGGCIYTHDALGIVLEMEKVWDDIASTSDSRRPFSVLRARNPAVSEAEKLIASGSKLSGVFRLSGAYVFDARKRDGSAMYSYVKRDKKGCQRLRRIALGKNQYLSINITASRLRFAPISCLCDDSFSEMWDSEREIIVGVPIGFKGKVQCGGGIFLLENESNELYVWRPDSGFDPQKWGYRWIWEGSSGSFFVAEDSCTGVQRAFVCGLTPVPGSDGATAITCGCISNGVQKYEIDLPDGKRIEYALSISEIGNWHGSDTPIRVLPYKMRTEDSK